MRRRLSLHIAGLACALLCAGQLAAQSAHIAFDSAVVETGEAFNLHLIVTGSAPDAVDFSAWEGVLPAQNILSRSEWLPQTGRWKMECTALLFDEGKIVFPPLPVRLKSGVILTTDTVQLQVIGTPLTSTDIQDMADIKNIHTEPKNWKDYLWIGWILGGLLTLGLLAYWWKKVKRPQTTPAISAPPLSPAALARQQLAEVERQQYWQNGAEKIYYSELSAIIRAYIDATFHTQTHQKGAQDALREIQHLPLNTRQHAALRTLLTNADLAKYAKGQPGPEYHPQAMKDALEIVGG